jgi:hypothetical protein
MMVTPRYSGDGGRRNASLRSAEAKLVKTNFGFLSEKQNKNKRVRGVVKVVEHLPSKHDALS